MRVPCNKYADTLTHARRYSPYLFRTTFTWTHTHTHTHTHICQVILAVSCLRWKQNTQWSPFLQQDGREVTASSSSTVPSVVPLFPPLFSFLLLHFTLARKQLNKTVFAKLLISWKSLGRFGRYEAFFVFYIRALVHKKRPFGFQSQYSERWWKPELCFLRPRPSAVRPITFRPEKSEGDAS